MSTLVAYGLSAKKAEYLLQIYPATKIREKIETLKAPNSEIKRPGAWLFQAFEEDWDNTIENQDLMLKNKYERNSKKDLSNICLSIILKKNLTGILLNKSTKLYQQLLEPIRQQLDEQYTH